MVASALGVHEASTAMPSAAVSASSRFLIMFSFRLDVGAPHPRDGASLSLPVPAGVKTSLQHGRRGPQIAHAGAPEGARPSGWQGPFVDRWAQSHSKCLE